MMTRGLASDPVPHAMFSPTLHSGRRFIQPVASMRPVERWPEGESCSMAAAGVPVIAAGAQRRRGADVRPRQRRGAGKPRHPRLRVHAGPLPALMATAIERRDVGVWAGERDIVTARPAG